MILVRSYRAQALHNGRCAGVLKSLLMYGRSLLMYGMSLLMYGMSLLTYKIGGAILWRVSVLVVLGLF